MYLLIPSVCLTDSYSWIYHNPIWKLKKVARKNSLRYSNLGVRKYLCCFVSGIEWMCIKCQLSITEWLENRVEKNQVTEKIQS